jgi:S1-C subfamily serine protease
MGREKEQSEFERTRPPYEHEREDFDYDAFFNEYDEDYEKEKEERKERKKRRVKWIGWAIVFVLLINGLAIWPTVVNLPAFEFLAVSGRLSGKEEIKEFKKSVVTIEWDGVKGTGFNLDADGLIVTNNHVVENANLVNVHFKAGDSYKGKVIAKHPDLDIAIIDIDAQNLPVLSITYEKSWAQGDAVVFIGNPLAFTQIANEGEIIGSTTLTDWDVPVMVIEAPIYKGNSGSPVLNQDGNVIGVVFATLRNPGVDAEGIVGVATPSIYLKEIIEQAKQ